MESLTVARDSWTKYVVRDVLRFERLYLNGMLELIPFNSLSPCSREPKANPISFPSSAAVVGRPSWM